MKQCQTCNSPFIPACNRQRFCPPCGKKHKKTKAKEYRPSNRSPEFKKKHREHARQWYLTHKNVSSAQTALQNARKFIRKADEEWYTEHKGLYTKRDTDSRVFLAQSLLKLKNNPCVLKANDELLYEISQGNGVPDWVAECIEEKKEGDCLSVAQFACATSYYKKGNPYKVSHRFSSTKRKVFETVWDYVLWKLIRGDILTAQHILKAKKNLLKLKKPVLGFKNFNFEN